MVQFWLCVIVLHLYRNQKSHLRDYRYDFGFLLRKNQQGRRRDIFMRKSRGKKKHIKKYVPSSSAFISCLLVR